MKNLDPEKRYRCPEEDCGHECMPSEMGADYSTGEAWSNWICPNCGQWWFPEDWIPL